MFKFIKDLFKRPKPLEYEWYCTRCGKDDIEHDEKGRLKGNCNLPVDMQVTVCPLDLRVKISKK